MNSLISSSIGLVVRTSDEEYFMQVITSDKEMHYFIPMDKEQAKAIRLLESLEILEVDEIPD